MASPRRVGSDTSKTHAVLLDSAEQLMLDRGYAAVTYRNVAANAGVYAGLVSYYFRTLDELFLALLRRRSERNLERLVESLGRARRPAAPCAVGVQYGRDLGGVDDGVFGVGQSSQVH